MIRLEVIPGLDVVQSLEALKAVAQTYPGAHRLQLVTAEGRRLTLGTAWSFDDSVMCLGTLSQLGDPQVVPDEPGDVAESSTQPDPADEPERGGP